MMTQKTPRRGWLSLTPARELVQRATDEIIKTLGDESGTLPIAHVIEVEGDALQDSAIDAVLRRLRKTHPDLALVEIQIGKDAQGLIVPVTPSVPWPMLKRLARVVEIICSSIGIAVPSVGLIGSTVMKATSEALDYLESRDNTGSANAIDEALFDDLPSSQGQFLFVVRADTTLLRYESGQIQAFVERMAAWLRWSSFGADQRASLLAVRGDLGPSNPSPEWMIHRVRPLETDEIQTVFSCTEGAANALCELTHGNLWTICTIFDALDGDLGGSLETVESLSESLRRQWSQQALSTLSIPWFSEPQKLKTAMDLIEYTALSGGIASVGYLTAVLETDPLPIALELSNLLENDNLAPMRVMGDDPYLFVPLLVRLSFRGRWSARIAEGDGPRHAAPRLMRALEIACTVAHPRVGRALQEAAATELGFNAWLLGRDDLLYSLNASRISERLEVARAEVASLVREIQAARTSKSEWQSIGACQQLITLDANSDGIASEDDASVAIGQLRRLSHTWPSARAGLLMGLLVHPTLQQSSSGAQTESIELLIGLGSMQGRLFFQALISALPQDDAARRNWVRAICIHIVRMSGLGIDRIRDAWVLQETLRGCVHTLPEFSHEVDCSRLFEVQLALTCTDWSVRRAREQMRIFINRAYAQGSEEHVYKWTSRMLVLDRQDLSEDVYEALCRYCLIDQEGSKLAIPILLRACQFEHPEQEAFWWWYFGESRGMPAMAAMGRMLAYWLTGSHPHPLLQDWAAAHPMEPILGWQLQRGTAWFEVSPADRDYVLINSGLLPRDAAINSKAWRKFSCDPEVALKQLWDDAPEGCDRHGGSAAVLEFEVLARELANKLGVEDFSETAWSKAVLACAPDIDLPGFGRGGTDGRNVRV